MGAAGLELPDWISEKSVEWAHGRAIRAQREQRVELAAAGMRAAKARDPHLLKALEGGAEILYRMNDRQQGARGFRMNGHRIDTTELQMWREAYRLCDEGEPILALQWIYAAGAVLAGLIA
jgi:hypothetical protein